MFSYYIFGCRFIAMETGVTTADFDNSNIAYFCVLIAVFIAGFVGLGRAELLNRFKMLFAWVALILLMVFAVTYWPNIQNSQFYASLVPATAIEGKNGEISVKKASDGHFYINASVNGQKIKFMVDTGASDIALTQKDAAKLGFDVENLNYNKVFSTANGTTRGASVKISYLEVGGFEMQDFYASVNQGALENSLLGMSFLSHFKSYKVEGETLILTP